MSRSNHEDYVLLEYIQYMDQNEQMKSIILCLSLPEQNCKL